MGLSGIPSGIAGKPTFQPLGLLGAPGSGRPALVSSSSADSLTAAGAVGAAVLVGLPGAEVAVAAAA